MLPSEYILYQYTYVNKNMSSIYVYDFTYILFNIKLKKYRYTVLKIYH